MTRSVLSITDCHYSKLDNRAIDCVITVNGKSFPFTASPADSTTPMQTPSPGSTVQLLHMS
ncbi:hypothetical protein D8682_04920 [Buttiauxella sp. 3AFRM03]|nr:hypothetical protein D8682_04920 [Buttiauxella sp. 3AFRM03]